jgi:hypothetical protein
MTTIERSSQSSRKRTTTNDDGWNKNTSTSTTNTKKPDDNLKVDRARDDTSARDESRTIANAQRDEQTKQDARRVMANDLTANTLRTQANANGDAVSDANTDDGKRISADAADASASLRDPARGLKNYRNPFESDATPNTTRDRDLEGGATQKDDVDLAKDAADARADLKNSLAPLATARSEENAKNVREMRELGPGDSRRVSVGVDVSGRGATAGGKVTIETKKNEDGSYTVVRESEGRAGAEASTSGPTEKSAKGTARIGGTVREEYRFKDENEAAEGMRILRKRDAGVGVLNNKKENDLTKDEKDFLAKRLSALDVRGNGTDEVTAQYGVKAGGAYAKGDVREEGGVRVEYENGKPKQLIVSRTKSASGEAGAIVNPSGNVKGVDVKGNARAAGASGNVSITEEDRYPINDDGSVGRAEQRTVVKRDGRVGTRSNNEGTETTITFTGDREQIRNSGAAEAAAAGASDEELRRRVGDRATVTREEKSYRTTGKDATIGGKIASYGGQVTVESSVRDVNKDGNGEAR